MSEALEVWTNGRFVGQFRRKDDVVTLAYDSDYDGVPLSVSLPIGQEHGQSKPGRYLENLLPDNSDVRERWGKALGTGDDAVQSSVYDPVSGNWIVVANN